MDAVQSMFSVREVPWHGKGIVVDHELKAEEAIVAAGLDWDVHMHPITVNGIEIVGHYATVRDDNKQVLGIVGDQYHVVQNRDLFRFFDPVIDLAGAYFHTGGSLFNGRVVWFLAKVPGDFYVPGVPDDLVQNYTLLAASHDGSLPVIAKSTPTRVVCNNTLSWALGQAGTEVRIKHTVNAKYELAQAHKVLGFTTRRAAALREAAELLLGINVGGRLLSRLLRTLFPSIPEEEGREASGVAKRHRERVELLFAGADTNNLPGMKGTGWAFYNAVTEYVDSDMPAREGTDRLARMWFGTGEELKMKAFQLLMKQLKTDSDN